MSGGKPRAIQDASRSPAPAGMLPANRPPAVFLQGQAACFWDPPHALDSTLDTLLHSTQEAVLFE